MTSEYRVTVECLDEKGAVYCHSIRSEKISQSLRELQTCYRSAGRIDEAIEWIKIGMLVLTSGIRRDADAIKVKRLMAELARIVDLLQRVGPHRSNEEFIDASNELGLVSADISKEWNDFTTKIRSARATAEKYGLPILEMARKESEKYELGTTWYSDDQLFHAIKVAVIEEAKGEKIDGQLTHGQSHEAIKLLDSMGGYDEVYEAARGLWMKWQSEQSKG